MKCSKCGAELQDGVSFCRECGTKIEKVKRFCRDCGAEIEEDSKVYEEKGLDTIRQHATDFIAKREAPAVIPNDGKQTPTKGLTRSSGP